MRPENVVLTQPRPEADIRVLKQLLSITASLRDCDDWHTNVKRIDLCFLSVLSLGVGAQETGVQTSVSDIVPADMYPGINPWDGAIESPEGSEDVEVVLRCKGRITGAGQLEDTYRDVSRLTSE